MPWNKGTSEKPPHDCNFQRFLNGAMTPFQSMSVSQYKFINLPLMKTVQNPKAIEWVLRIAVAGEFLGHGVFGLQGKESWIKYVTATGFSESFAQSALPIVGGIDVFLAILVLVYPVRVALLWMAIWGAWTALLRPIAGEPIWDFVERFANWGAPLALLLLSGWPQSLKEWFKK